MNWSRKVGKIILVLGVLVVVTFFPGIFTVISENSDNGDKLIGSLPKSWSWSLQDVKLSVLEMGCALPFSHCEKRPYHRRILSYFLCNILSGAVCAAFFYPAYIHGYVLPLPSATFSPSIRIGLWDIIRP
ncbi:hypothetical protein JTE90_019759 [Oedothorax gibbosus]|uniref:Uncharacterized protein n=1 Tax=Oedothorax gibbosus TaxID=931172 RepID=A0AAV6TL84_9ARAC|nr:hypothetical protein JTE90_007598 [Oedothorax gibbosus]KAG8185504.1 hypothetical protein JTE90_019759 [Oedothorax gibbosus]